MTAVRVPRHPVVEDVLAVLTGTNLSALGVYILHSAGLVTGGTAGLSLLLDYVTGIPFAVVFMGVNLPFFVVAWVKRGPAFALMSVLCVLLVSVLSDWERALLGPIAPNPVFAAVVGNLLAGTGVLILFRHGGSLGGFNIVSLLLAERTGIRAGWIMLAFDLLILVLSALLHDWATVLGSAVGATVLNLVVVFNHRPGRYRVSTT